MSCIGTANNCCEIVANKNTPCFLGWGERYKFRILNDNCQRHHIWVGKNPLKLEPLAQTCSDQGWACYSPQEPNCYSPQEPVTKTNFLPRQNSSGIVTS